MRFNHGDRILGEDNGEVVIIECVNANEVVHEGWYDVAF